MAEKVNFAKKKKKKKQKKKKTILIFNIHMHLIK